ncbi:aminotransferase class I/II-fold pyridoxal phosphate-dependent enzyme [Leptolyngbya sp. 15MV]|nr:aminotransferase class I/II-fold pyridoxal phosphate-dependent enzyme [Leptolyngbya sp. 15MV]
MTTRAVASRFVPFGTTIFAEMTALANRHGAVNLSQGFPDFEGPDFIKRAAERAMRDRPNQYGRMQGVDELNRALSRRWTHDTGQAIDGETQITVTSGCTEALAATFLGLLNPGDKVVLIEPFYDCYAAGAAMAGAGVLPVPLRFPPNGAPSGAPLQIDEGELRAAFAQRPRAIVVNTPHNPTGKVFSRAELELIARLCVDHDVVAITDEVYEWLTFEPELPHIRLATLPGMAERTITLSSLGKTFSLTGWKVGWAVASPELTRAVRAAHQFLVFCAPVPLQHAAAEAIEVGGEGERAARQLAIDLRERRDFLAGVLRGCGFRLFPSPGSYFIVADHSGLAAPGLPDGLDDVAMSRWLTTEVGVATIPCSAFYADRSIPRTLLRFTFGKRRETLEAAAQRLQRLRS